MADNPTTLYHRIVVGRETDSRAALEELFRKFWPPMYVFARAKGDAHEDAADFVRRFMSDEQRSREWKPERGRLRTFLLEGLASFRANELPREPAETRTDLPCDFAWSRDRYEQSAREDEAPERQFDREWAELVALKTRQLVELEYVRRGKAKEYRILSRCLRGRSAGGRRVSSAELAHDLGVSEPALKQKLWQLRQRHRHTLARQVAETVDDSAVEEEILFITDLVTAYFVC